MKTTAATRADRPPPEGGYALLMVLCLAAVTFVVPVVGLILKPTDFSPGIPQVFLLNGVFVLMFVVAGLLLRHAALPQNSDG